MFALASLVYLIWAAWLGVIHPYDGITSFHATGLIGEVDLNSPTAKVIWPGDTIVQLDGVAFSEANPFYAGKHAGDTVTLLIKRNDQLITDFDCLDGSAIRRNIIQIGAYVDRFNFLGHRGWSTGI